MSTTKTRPQAPTTTPDPNATVRHYRYYELQSRYAGGERFHRQAGSDNIGPEGDEAALAKFKEKVKTIKADSKSSDDALRGFIDIGTGKVEYRIVLIDKICKTICAA